MAVKKPYLRGRVRDFDHERDHDRVLSIWLNAEMNEYLFMEGWNWAGTCEQINTVLESGDIYVWEDKPRGRVLAFIALLGEEIVALRVDPKFWNLGLAGRLVRYAKDGRNALHFKVHEVEIRTLAVLVHNYFHIVGEVRNEFRRELLYDLAWYRR